MKLEGSYVLKNKRARYWRSVIASFTWAANQQQKVELSRLPAGEYLLGLFFILEVDVERDGNGADGISTAAICDLVESIKITDGFGTQLDLSLYKLGQHYKLDTGHNPILPPDLAVSSGASEQHDFVKVIVPFYYSKWRFRRPHDFAMPTTILQDANLSIKFGPDLLPGDAASMVQSATLNVVSLTSQMNRAIIPPVPEVGEILFSNATIQLGKGNYQHVWATGFKKSDFLAFGTLRADADGMPVIDSMRPDYIAELASLDLGFCDDDLQMHMDVLNNGSVVTANDKNVPPQPSATFIDAEDDYFFPIYYGVPEMKISNLLRVENRFNITMVGTNHDKEVCYARFRNHNANEVHQKARVMGFGSGSKIVSRTARRKLQASDGHLKSALPIRIVQVK